ncbi:unnamed protein product, partial [Mesorhabditis belari]|uniref:Uncharacterized protein n=1 Tax=Mesorhabditis belari TaxID=2138241 RepID=A0AAF3FJ78_9BILA
MKALLVLTIVCLTLLSLGPVVEAYCFFGECIDVTYQGCSGLVTRGSCGGGRNIQCCHFPRSGIFKRSIQTTGN